jgi:fluoride exporter
MSRLLLFVGVGGFAGATVRYVLSGYVQQATRSAAFPFGTLAVNVLGCFVIGLLSKLVESHGLFTADARALVLPGFLGGFTTFSTFGNETMNLFRDAELPFALANVAANVVLGLGAVWAGRTVAALIWR